MIDNIYSLYLECNQKISTDSRNIIAGSVFFALKGENFNGNNFAEEALKKGAAYAIVDEPICSSDKVILVKDVLHTLQELASFHRRTAGFKLIALTGSNGKTTTKELIRTVLSTQYSCFATQGNLNNHIGVPITILSAPTNTEFLIVEMGANHRYEIKQLAEIAQPDFGLITNIGKAHLEGFGGFEGVVAAKSELYHYLMQSRKHIFVNASDELLVKLLAEYENVHFYGTPDSDCYAGDLFFDKSISVDLFINKKPFKLTTQLFGKYNVVNILAAIKIGLFFHIDINSSLKALEAYVPSNNRSQILTTNRNTLVLDSYNANPSSMDVALDSFFEIKAKRQLVILGAMKELGEYSFIEHENLVKKVIRNANTEALFVGEEFLPFNSFGIKIFSETESLSNYLKEQTLSNYLIFIKGSRSNKLEMVIPFL